MSNQPTPQWQPISMLPTIAYLIDGTLASAKEQYTSLQAAAARPFSLNDALVRRVITLFTKQRDDQGLFDEQLARWEKDHPTPAQLAEITQLKKQMQEWHTVVTAILALAEDLKEQTIERLFEKDDAEVGLEFLLGTLGKPKKKPTK